jgi:hypothetical protein
MVWVMTEEPEVSSETIAEVVTAEEEAYVGVSQVLLVESMKGNVLHRQLRKTLHQQLHRWWWIRWCG